ncbi:Sigma-24 [Bacteroidales bacterium Barb7]|nr:Sigma-24 [Bacteroidales bacterium Barb7]
MELYTDSYYVQRVQAGDTACFACLLDKYSRRVHTLIVRIVGNREDAEELTQDVFMKVYRSLPAFKGDSSFPTWLYRIAYNTAISETRRKKYEFPAIEESLLANISEEETDLSEQTDHLEAALALLPLDERAVILLYYMEDKAVEEVSAITGLSASNVKTKLFRIRKKLFVLLKRLEE